MSKQKSAVEDGRPIKFKVRPSIVTNVLISGEKSGKDTIEKHDVLFSQLLEAAEVPQFLEPKDGDGELELWTKNGEARYTELGALPLALKASGAVKIGYAKGTAIEFTGTLKKLHIEARDDHRATLSGQVRVEPGNHHKMLAQLKIERTCKLGFDGVVDGKHEPDDGDEQEKLPL